MCSSDSDTARFELSSLGAIRHWLVAGPQCTPYAGPPGSDQELRTNSLDYTTSTPPPKGCLDDDGPYGLPWTYHDPGRNEFVEFSTFYTRPTVLNYWAFTEIMVPTEGDRTVRFWSAGAADLYVNGTHLKRLNITRYRNPDSALITLPLHAGLNRLCVRLQCLGLRDTRILFGLFVQQPGGIEVHMPRAAQIAEASRWIDSVRPSSPQILESNTPAPANAQVLASGNLPQTWPADSRTLTLLDRPYTLKVEVEVSGVTVCRNLEIPSNRPLIRPCMKDRREAHLRYVGRAGINGETAPGWNAVALSLLARRLLGGAGPDDSRIFADALSMITNRYDCSDFVLAGLLRMEMLKLTTPSESSALRDTALGFRYWLDEPGNDAMCFNSENHSLLFHGCQLLAGQLYTKDLFRNSGRTGEKQAEVAMERIWSWLRKVEARGFEEFNSGTYIPITIGAMLNVVDFAPEPELVKRMRLLIDRIFRDLARHTFQDAVISPQGRVYRDVLYPEGSGTLALVAYATDDVEVELEAPRQSNGRSGSGDWVAFLASSPSYRPPEDVADLCREPVSCRYRQADAQIVLEKTSAYLLTSLAVPAPPREGEHPQKDLRPGGAGYQQHLWQASLDRECHVFVNHPGGFFDGTPSRPGYWHGNGLIPRVRQEGNWLQAIHVISDGSKTRPEMTPEIWEWANTATVRPYDLHPISFTHAHWPTDTFDEHTTRDGWHFGRKGRGIIGLWCSESLVPHDDVLTGRELRAYAYTSAWVVVCGDVEETGSFESFITSCLERKPRFDPEAYILYMQDETPTRWWERSEPMPS